MENITNFDKLENKLEAGNFNIPFYKPYPSHKLENFNFNELETSDKLENFNTPYKLENFNKLEFFNTLDKLEIPKKLEFNKKGN